MKDMHVPWVLLPFFIGVALETMLPGSVFLWHASVIAVSVSFFLLIQSKYFLKITLVTVGFAVGLLRTKGGAFDVPLYGTQVYLESIRDSFVFSIRRVLPEPHASYLAGILVGVRTAIPADLRRAFRVTGTSHLTALSGYNVTVIAEYIKSLTTRIWVPIISVALFVLGTGASSSVVRAALMAMLLLVVRRGGYEYGVSRSLLLAAALMVFVSPALLLGDIGFQLSVAATWGIAELAPRVEKRLHFIPGSFHIRESLVTTLAAQAATAPLILWYFGSVSLIAPLVNVLVLPTMPILMACGFVAGLSGFFGSAAGAIISWPAYLLLEYQLVVIEFFADRYVA